jgi:hypothetical protein
MLAYIFFLLPLEHDTSRSSPFSGTGNAIAALFFIVLGIAIAFKVAIVTVIEVIDARRNARDAGNASPQSRAEPAETRITLPGTGIAMLATGALAGLCLVLTLAVSMARLRPSWVFHASAVVLAVALWAAVPWFVGMAGAGRKVQQFAAGLRRSVLALSIGGGAAAWASIDLVTERAEAIAKDAPYCIWVANRRGGYDPAAAFVDLSPLTMQAHCVNQLCEPHHAVLVVEDGGETTLLNWSYRKGGFFPDVGYPPPAKAGCGPQPHFARRLPLL